MFVLSSKTFILRSGNVTLRAPRGVDEGVSGGSEAKPPRNFWGFGVYCAVCAGFRTAENETKGSISQVEYIPFAEN